VRKSKRQINFIKTIEQNKAGFTLVELMVVVVVIGILVAIAVPVYNSITIRVEQATIENNLRVLDSAIMMYHAKNGQYPTSDFVTGEDGMEWIMNSPWRDDNSLASFVVEFKSVGGESYAIFGRAYAKQHAQADIATNRAFIILNSGETVGGHKAQDINEHYCLANLPWNKLNLQEVPILSGVVLKDGQDGVTIATNEQGKIVLDGRYKGNDAQVIIPPNVEEIGQRVFDHLGHGELGEATLITSIYFEHPSSIKVIGANAFRGAGLTAVDLPEGLITIGNYAFNGNPLTEIAIPDSVTKIGTEAFKGSGSSLSSIKKITIGSGVDIGNGLFHRDNNDFRDVYSGIDGGAGTYMLENGVWQKQQD
jgi:prepilin-type N-terminal cleavage/methylation domain-containing protein